MAASGSADGGGWSAVPGRSREVAPPGPAHRRGGGGGGGGAPWLALVGVGEASEGVVELEIWYGERMLGTYRMEVSKEGAAALVAGLAGAVFQKVAVGKRRYKQPAAVLQYALRIATAESELMERAMVRSGKTAAMVPALMAAARGSRGERRGEWDSAPVLLLAPTRDLSTLQLHVGTPEHRVVISGRPWIFHEEINGLVVDEADRMQEKFEFLIRERDAMKDMPKRSSQTVLFSVSFSTDQQIELSRKYHDCNPSSEGGYIGGESTGEIQYNMSGTRKTRKQGSGGNCRIYSSSCRIWILALVVLFLASMNTVAGMSSGPDNSVCAAEGVPYDNNFCPAKGIQYKRVRRDDVSIPESNLPRCKEHECLEAEKKETKCQEKGVDSGVALAAAIFTSISNLGPMVPIMSADQGSPHRRHMLCLTSLYLAASSCSWMVYLGPEDCINWFCYASLAIALLLHSFYAWFFWQGNHRIISLYSLFTLVGSTLLAVGISFLAKAKFMKIGIVLPYAKSTPAVVAGLLGHVLTYLAILYRRRSRSERIDCYTMINIFCALLGTIMFTYCIHWKEFLNILIFKAGVILMFLYRLYEVFQLIWSYRHGRPQHETIPGDNNDEVEPLLEPENSNGQNEDD